jgi:L-ribulose-5-phosphate 4-epimerase
VVHTHSTHATAFAQAGRDIPILGTTHADLSPLAVPVARELTDGEVAGAYEVATGHILIETVRPHGTAKMPAALAPGHGPFTWGHDAVDAVENAVALEEIARMAILTLGLNPDAPLLPGHVRDKHYNRKHGPNATYGQTPHDHHDH